MTLDRLLIHPVTKANLQAFAAQPSHALLLIGSTGIGKHTVAEVLAHDLEPAAAPEFIRPDDKGVIRIEAIRELYRQTRSKRQQGQIIILEDVDAMSAEAENAFLKLLEEPRPGVIFLLTATHLHALLLTTISRVQRLDILPVTSSILQKHFAKPFQQCSPAHIAQILFIAQGRPAITKTLIDNPELLKSQQELMQQAKQLLTATRYERLAAIMTLPDKQGSHLMFEAMLLMSQLQLTTAPKTMTRHWLAVNQALQIALRQLTENRNLKAVTLQLFSSW
jgi:DNA polymerase-3 subunit delta'